MADKKVTQEEFDTALYDYVREHFDDNPADILDIKGVYEILSEELNNDVLDYIKERK